MAEAWVYMLRCSDGSLYTGWSTDVDRRLARHRAGKASRYTASRLPVELVLARQVADRGAAMRVEARFKRLDRAGKLALIDAEGHAGAPPQGRAGVTGGVAP
jgi:putative endonuclease